MVAIVVLHREDDVPFAAGRIQDRLEAALGRENVLLQRELGRADVVVAVVGPYWEADPILGIYDPRDELQVAAADGIPVVVVEIKSLQQRVTEILRVEDATHGIAARLEQSLSTRSATVEVEGGGFDRGIEDVLHAIRTLATWRREPMADKGQGDRVTEFPQPRPRPRIILPERIPAAPGTRTSVQGEVKNTSDLVDEYNLAIVGEAAEWTDLVPKSVAVFPMASVGFGLTFFPPLELLVANRWRQFRAPGLVKHGWTELYFIQRACPPAGRRFHQLRA